MKILRKISLFAIIAITLFLSVYTQSFAYAEGTSYYYDTSSVIADLNGGQEKPESEFFPERYLRNIFKDSISDILQGNFNFLQDIWVISFIENGYGTDKFGIYLYVYNPNNLDILTDSDKNKVQFAACNSETAVFSSDYVKYNVVLLDKTENNKYMKFKVDGFLSLQSSERYYAVSGIELHINGNANATEYPIGSVYHCSTRDGQTNIYRETLNTVQVDCTHVCYRTDDSEKGNGWSNQLSACYFSLPKEYSFGNNPYGTLSEIKADFYLYYTKPILLLNNENLYYDFGLAYALSTSSAEFQNNQFINCNDLSFGVLGAVGANLAVYPFGYNINDFNFRSFFGSQYVECNGFLVENNIDALYWLFCDVNADFDDEDYYFPAERLESFYDTYKSFCGLNMFEDRQYFEDNNISRCGFNYGHNNHTYSISKNPEEGAVLGYELIYHNNDFWANFFDGIFGYQAIQSVSGIAPLVRVEYEDARRDKVNALTDEQFSEKYLVDKNQVRDLRNKVITSTITGQEVWLFRYDCSEYYGAKAKVYDKNISNNVYDGLVCQEPVYLDWDILSFKFEQDYFKDGTITKTTVPVNHSPENVFSDLTRSANDFPENCKYESMFRWLMLCGLAVLFWYVITKISRNVKGK